MHLCIDIGNSKAKVGICDQRANRPDEWLYVSSRRGISLKWIKDLCHEYDISAAIVANTRDYKTEIREALESLPHFVTLDHNTPIPVNNHYKTPETLGRDRLAAVCGANGLHPGQNCLVIDAGTCITIDLVDDRGNYHGGSIHPGITMRFKALNNYTGKLPLVKRQRNTSLSGDSTDSAIRAGVLFAVVKEVEGMIEAYRQEHGELKVIITGGDAPFFVSQVKSKIFAHANLVLTGLSKILEYNVDGL